MDTRHSQTLLTDVEQNLYRHLTQDDLAVVACHLQKVYQIDVRGLFSVVLQLYDNCLTIMEQDSLGQSNKQLVLSVSVSR